MFEYRNEALLCDGVSLAEIAAAAGTPCYVYSAEDILAAWRAYNRAFGAVPHLVCYAVKANSTLGVLHLLAREGSGFDIVSGGELHRVLKAGGDAQRVVFSGVGKTAEEIEFALRSGILRFNCESEGELAAIDAIAGRLGLIADFGLRVNPDVEADTHKHISTGRKEHKFGIDIAEAPSVYARSRAFRNLRATAVACHIGSQILDYSSILEAARKVLALARALRSDGYPISHADLGGGLGIAYRDDRPAPSIPEFVASLTELACNSGLAVEIEPGRSIVGNAGVLLTRVLYRKRTGEREFVVVDAAMNDLIRPVLYEAHHEILPLKRTPSTPIVADVVGPVCETGDFLARGRSMPAPDPGDLLAVMSAGAYGFVQASNYNSRPRPAEILVSDGSWRTIRDRETFDDLLRGEKL